MPRTVRVQPIKRFHFLSKQRNYLRTQVPGRFAFRRWRLYYQRLENLERLGTVYVIAETRRDNRSRTHARAQAKAEGRLWTREMDRSFRSPRKKTKALNVTAEKRLKTETEPAPKPKKRKQSAVDSQPISKAPVKRTKRKA